MSSKNQKLDPRHLLDRIVEKEKKFRSKNFVAPYTAGSKTAIVRMEGINYTFRIVGFTGSGFGVFTPIDATCAKFTKEAECDVVQNYLSLFPKIHFVLAFETDLGWCGYPLSVDSTKKRFGLDREVIVRNASDVERFDVVVVRYDGNYFWYEGLFAGGDPIKSSFLRDCFALRENAQQMGSALKNISGLTPEEEKAFGLAIASWKEYNRSTTEGRLRETLGRDGALLSSYVIRGQNIEINWRARSGGSYVSVVNKDSLDVESAGICLDGYDKRFHLKDLPDVIAQGEREGAIYHTHRSRPIDFD